MIHPTRRFVLLLVLGIAVALVPVVIDTRLWPVAAAFSGGALLLFFADIALGVPSRRLDVRVESPELIFIGRPGTLKVELAAPDWRRDVHVRVLPELHADIERVEEAGIHVPAGEAGSVELPLAALRRGAPDLRALWLGWCGPFGLAERRRIERLDRTLRVVPDIHSVRAAALRFSSSREFLHGLKIERHVGEGSEFESLREYVPGLDARTIDWRATARHTKLVCVEHRAERNHQVFLCFDTGHLMSEPMAGIPKLDHAVNAALLLSYVCLRTGDRVGLFAFDAKVRHFTAPRAGVAAVRQIQAHTAGLAYSTEETNFTVGLLDLLTRLNRRSLVILFTDFVDSVTAELMLDNVRHLVRRHVVLFVALRDASLARIAGQRPDSLLGLARAVTADDLITERERVLTRLGRLGVTCIDAAPDEIGAQLINRYLDLKRREKIA